MFKKLQIFQWICYLKLIVFISLVASQEKHYSGDNNVFYENVSHNYALQRQAPSEIAATFRNPYKSVRNQIPKKFVQSTGCVDSSCVKNIKKKKAAEEMEKAKAIPSGNRWHGAVFYGAHQKKFKIHQSRSTKARWDITQVERKLHKCYKWVNSKELKHYKWPAIIHTIANKNLHHIEICCPQFVPTKVMGNILCLPFCSHCSNGDCVAPEKCRCFDGFILTDNEDCVFTCPISCLNGRCSLMAGTCLCNSGFKLDETGKFCRPICRAGCGMNHLHNCTAPEMCSCMNGFILTDNDCQPLNRG